MTFPLFEMQGFTTLAVAGCLAWSSRGRLLRALHADAREKLSTLVPLSRAWLQYVKHLRSTSTGHPIFRIEVLKMENPLPEAPGNKPLIKYLMLECGTPKKQNPLCPPVACPGDSFYIIPEGLFAQIKLVQTAPPLFSRPRRFSP